MPPEIKKEIAGTFSIGTDKTKEEEEPQSRLVAGSMVTIGIVAVGNLSYHTRHHFIGDTLLSKFLVV